MSDKRFDLALYSIGENIRNSLMLIPDSIKEKTEEIRLRAGNPVALSVEGKNVFLRPDGKTCLYICSDLLKADSDDLNICYKLLCRNSVYAHTEELKKGFIRMKNGCRAGVCGTLTEKGFMKDITSINIRIARQIYGAADEIIRQYKGGGLLIAGAPASGKTTVLRDFVRQAANGNLGQARRVCVIDGRGEISGCADLGACSDVLITEDKANGAQIALRTMNPDIIAFDEIGSVEELNQVTECFYSGVSVVCTAHIGCVEELKTRNITRLLLSGGAIGQVAVLPPKKGDSIKIYRTQELLCGVAT